MTLSAPRLAATLVRREATWVPIILVLATAAASVWAAYYVAEAGPQRAPGLLMLRRFDRVVMSIAQVLLVARIATRAEADTTVNWTAPFIAARAPRWHYGAAVLGAATVSMFAVALTAAVCFAVGMFVFGDSSELLRALPRDVAGGTLLLIAFGSISMTAAILLRQSIVTFLTVLALLAAPWIVMMMHVRASADAPPWLHHWLRFSPSFYLPSDASAFLRTGLVSAVGIALMLLVSHRHAGRHT